MAAITPEVMHEAKGCERALKASQRLRRHCRQLGGRNQVRRNLGQRHEHERPLVEARMRHLQAGTIDAPTAKEKQIQVQRARRIAIRARGGGREVPGV
jgi:hypothetical protein